jgi:hypothetical protein
VNQSDDLPFGDVEILISPDDRYEVRAHTVVYLVRSFKTRAAAVRNASKVKKELVDRVNVFLEAWDDRIDER